MLNVRNKFCKTPGRCDITKDSLPDIKKQIDDYISYIERLEIDVPVKKSKQQNATTESVRKSVIDCHSVKTGFVGFIICLKNLYALAKDLIENNIVEYFLSYKLSQDHVEMFFSLIRRMNGHNNNPTNIQYKSAYKKLLLNKLNVLLSSSANCSLLDNTLLISEGSCEENQALGNTKSNTDSTNNINDETVNLKTVKTESTRSNKLCSDEVR